MSFATASRHHQTSFTRVSTICTMAHLKRVSKSRGNADADADAEDNVALTIIS